eukprot:2689996-Amphidinium_carterae.1
MVPSADCLAQEAAQGASRTFGTQTCEVGVAAAQKQGKGRVRRGGMRANKSEGWYCKHCDFYNFGYRPVCFRYKEQKAPRKDPPGVPAKKPKPALKKQSADSKDMPALQQHLQADLAAAQAHKRETLPVKDQRKVLQQASQKRDSLREELVTVYLHLQKLPKEELPVPKKPVATSSD